MLPIKIHFPRWLKKGEVKVLTFLSHLKALWRIWDLRTLILLSLGLQVILILIAPFRKKTANAVVVITVWLAYLLADFIAIQAIGLIPNYSARSTTNAASSSYTTHPDLLAFWAPFLLVHLGGPDPITALALEDNELWLRTALHLFTYISATGRVFFQSLPTNILSLPTILMFFAGFFKYLERTLSMYYASLTKLRPSMLTDPDHGIHGPNYAKIMEDYEFYLQSSARIRLEESDNDEMETHGFGRLRNVKLARDAFEFFEKYKGLYVDLIFSFADRNKSRAYFLDPLLTPEEAFTVLEMELNFTHEFFFTKMIVIRKKFGTTIRCASFVFEVGSLIIWILFTDKQPFHGFDIWITYTLLVGAIIIDSIAFLMVVLSDWKFVMLIKRDSKRRAFLYEILLSARKRAWGEYWGRKESPLWPQIRRVFFRRWSESVFQFNLIDYCVDSWSDCTELFFKVLPLIKAKCEEFKYLSKKWFANDLRDFIFKELRSKAEIATHQKDAEEICNSKGDWVLRSLGIDPNVFREWTTDVEYDECLLMWHIATELLYQSDYATIGETSSLSREKDYIKYCKTFSDYMMYILNWQRGLMSTFASISELRLRDTCAEATIFLDSGLPKAEKGQTKEQRLKRACKKMMDVNTDIRPMNVKGDRSKSVLFDAVRLAKELRETEKKVESVGMWELMAKVWLELMGYSATHCRASAHAAQLKQGGELLTLVWLLMVHLGLGDQFRLTKERSRAKLVIK